MFIKILINYQGERTQAYGERTQGECVIRLIIKDQIFTLIIKDQIFILIIKDQIFTLIIKDQIFTLIIKDQIFTLIIKDQIAFSTSFVASSIYK